MLYESRGWNVFRVAQIDVSVSGSYLFVVALILVFSMNTEFVAEGLLNGVFFVLALTSSVLIHEFGHAAVCKRYGLAPSILLHGFGGVCFHTPASTDRRDLFIVLAGPLVEIFFGILAFVLIYSSAMGEWALQDDIGGRLALMAHTFTNYFAWVSVIWGLINLCLPLWPLDGGRLCLLLLRRLVSESKAQEATLRVSVFLCVPIVILSFYFGFLFVGLMGVFLAMENLNLLRSGTALVHRPGKVEATDWVRETMRDTEEAFQRSDWHQVYQSCHRMRSANDPIPPPLMRRLWEMLAVSAVELEEWDEAQGWLDRAPDTARVRAARKAWTERGGA